MGARIVKIMYLFMLPLVCTVYRLYSVRKLTPVQFIHSFIHMHSYQ